MGFGNLLKESRVLSWSPVKSLCHPIATKVWLKSHNNGAGAMTMVKSTGYTYRGPEFLLSQYLHGSLWLSITSVLWMLMPSSDLQLAPGTHKYTNIHVGKTVLHINMNKTFFNFSFRNKTNKAHRQLSTGDRCPIILVLWSESQADHKFKLAWMTQWSQERAELHNETVFQKRK